MTKSGKQRAKKFARLLVIGQLKILCGASKKKKHQGEGKGSQGKQSKMKKKNNKMNDLRLHRLGVCIYKILNLARLLSDCIERRRVRGCVLVGHHAKLPRLAVQVIACCSSYLRHVFFLCIQEEGFVFGGEKKWGKKGCLA